MSALPLALLVQLALSCLVASSFPPGRAVDDVTDLPVGRARCAA